MRGLQRGKDVSGNGKRGEAGRTNKRKGESFYGTTGLRYYTARWLKEARGRGEEEMAISEGERS